MFARAVIMCNKQSHLVPILSFEERCLTIKAAMLQGMIQEVGVGA